MIQRLCVAPLGRALRRPKRQSRMYGRLGGVRGRGDGATTPGPVDVCVIKFTRLGLCLLVKGIVPTDVLAGLELGVLLTREHTERVRTEVVTL